MSSMEQHCYSLNPEAPDEAAVYGIPFRIARLKEGTKPLSLPAEIPCGRKCDYVFFLGMTCENGQGSEWWGQYEREFDYTERLFIGDTIAKIHIIYEDGNENLIPVIFGVNAWNYELYEPVKPWEGNLRTFFGPYREPFESDVSAGKLLRDSLRLMENREEWADKRTKWVMCCRPGRRKSIDRIVIENYPHKKCGLAVSAVTVAAEESELPSAWPVTDPAFYLKKEWYWAADSLARRLYQYADKLPKSVPLVTPKGYEGPEALFEGNLQAELFTNIYRVNVHDIAEGKLDGDGLARTSSHDTLDFGCYVGFGSFRKSSAYALQIWSRDAGRTMIEAANAGITEKCRRAVDCLHELLYGRNDRLFHPHWKRIANIEPDWKIWDTVQGAENDGHASLMLFIVVLFRKGIVDAGFLSERKKALADAAGWFLWQMEHPEVSDFDNVLFSHSEASSQERGGYDLFSNSMAVQALRGYGDIFEEIGSREEAEACFAAAGKLADGCREVFGSDHPRYGTVYTDTADDCWTWEYKRFAPLFLLADTVCYDAHRDSPLLYDEMERTFRAQKEEYYSLYAGRQMGYGQGFLTETALMLDRYEEMTECVGRAAEFCYHHTDAPYIVPEGVVVNGMKTCWFRSSDLGNGVQQGEIIKCARLILGLDDLDCKAGLKFVPRMPDGWNCISVKQYPVAADSGLTSVDYRYERLEHGFQLSFSAEREIRAAWLRFGPFPAGTEKAVVSGGLTGEYQLEDVGSRRFIYVLAGGRWKNLSVTVECR